MSCKEITNEINEAKLILCRDGHEKFLEYCKETFGENDGVGIAEDIIELWGTNET